MPTRRDFHRLTVGAAAGAAVPVTLWPGTIAQAAPVSGPGAAVTVEESATQIIVDNGPVRLVVGKANNGRATSLRFNGQELMASGGMGYYDVNSEALGTPVPLPPTVAAYTVRQGPDFVDVACTIGPTTGGPFTTVRHYIVRAGEPGIYLATEFHHTADVHGFRAAQHRFVLRVDPTIFTHASVEDDAVGPAWRAAAAALPTPAELSAAPEVMDATDDLAGLGSAYPRRYYTKYDWAVYLKDHRVHGLYGNGYGVWAVLANLEAFAGGPTRQDLTLHQTNTTPVLLVEPQATHYGSPAIEVNGAWSKTYGPYYLHLNTGTDPVVMRADALRHADPECHREFYDRVALAGWVPSAGRATVTGRVRIPGRHNMAGAVAVLSDNRVDFQRTVHGYQYWADVNVNGSFRLCGVRPGTYRLSVYRPGVWGEYVRDDVVITAPAGGPQRLAEANWLPLRHGRTRWQIGRPDRMSAEFRRGLEFRQYGLQAYYPVDFPDGVTYTVGRSTNADWNYVQYQRINGELTAPWRILFDLDRAPRRASSAILTIALAAWAMDTARPVPPEPSNLTIVVNDTTRLVWTFGVDDARGATYRSSAAGLYLRREFRFDPAVLRAGSNTISLQINADAPAQLGNQAAYDAIRLELA